MLHLGYEEAKRMADQRAQKSLHRYRTMAALAAQVEASPVGSAHVVELVVPGACNEHDRIRA